jgi:hypothetical protein
MAKNKTIGRSGNFSQTPQEWEAATGNKLLSYRTDKSGMLDIGNMKYKTAAKLAEEASAKSSPGASMVESSFGRMIGGSPSGGGFIGSMGGLEAASMRLADAAAKRERETIGYETGMKKELMASERKFEQQKELDTEIRNLQMQIAEVGATPKTPQSVSLYNSLRKQLEDLKSQRNSIR